MNKALLLGTLLFLTGQTLVWFQTNSQLVWDWWKDKPFMAALVFSLPIALAFWYGTKHIYEATGELWTARYVAFGISYITFPFLTQYFLGESMLTAKTLVCTGLAIIIVCIQFFWK